MLIRRRTGWTGRNAPRVLLAALSVLALLAGGCSSDDGLSADEAATVAGGSEVEYAVDGGTWTTLAGGGVVPAGAQVRTEDEAARLTFRGGTVRLSPAASATLDNNQVTLERGEALIATTGDLSAILEDTTVSGAATYRLASGLSARVGVYAGEVAVRRPAQERTVPALRELDLAQFRLAAQPSPLRYHDSDAWDRELLAGAIAFDGEATRLIGGMELELESGLQPGRFYQRFTSRNAVPALASAAPRRDGPSFGPPPDVLLLYFVADAATTGDVVAAIGRVADLRAAGARWGLIALDLGVPAADVVAAIDDLDTRQLALADLAPDARTASGARVDAAGGSTGGGGGDGTTGTSDTTTVPTSTDTGTTTTSGDDDNDGGGGGDDPAPPGGGGDDPTPPGGGGGEEPTPPPPEDPSPTKVVEDVVETVQDPPDGEDFNAGSQLPEELDAVGDLIDGDN